MKNLIESLVLSSPLLGVILGPIVSVLVDWVKRSWSWLDAQGPLIKQAAAVVVAFALVLVVRLGVAAPPACTDVLASGVSPACQAALASSPFIQAVIAALVAVLRKHGKQVNG